MKSHSFSRCTRAESVSPPSPTPSPPQTDAEKRFCRDDLEIEALDQHNYDFIAEILNSGQCTNQFHA